MTFSALVVLLVACLNLVTAVPGNHAPSAVIDAGLIIGTTTVLPSSTATVNKFLGIPYAVTPPKRFQPPERLARYHGTVNATQLPHLCFQQNYAHETAEQVANESEDCLYLNVYIPAARSCKGGRTVMVWVHGGDLSSGTSSDPTFDGSSMAANQDVVVVTFNYRVNVFGFPNAPNLPLASRNVGFLDQRLALDWVQENIASFGGDPRKVTIFGESSGASSIDRLLTTMPLNRNKPLPFRAAILQSGQASVSPFQRDGGPTSWSTLVSALNCNSTASADEFACVQNVDALTIRNILNSAGLEFRAVSDNVTQIATPIAADQPRAPVPILIGSNGQEGMNLGPQYGITDFDAVTKADIELLLYALTGSVEVVGAIEPLIDLIRSQFPWFNLFQAGALMYTEVLYQCPAKRVAETTIHSGTPAWRYYYNATIPNLQPENYPTLGAFHGADLAMVFGTYPGSTATEQERALSTFMQTAWAMFAKNPTSGPGWKAADDEIACLGCDGSFGVRVIKTSVVDSRCKLYAPLYTATVPYFRA